MRQAVRYFIWLSTLPCGPNLIQHCINYSTWYIENDGGILDFWVLRLTELFNISFLLPIFISVFICQILLTPCFNKSYIIQLQIHLAQEVF